jgi:hypothetical protein
MSGPVFIPMPNSNERQSAPGKSTFVYLTDEVEAYFSVFVATS